ncbi:MAG: GMP synthase subunit A [Methanothrix sp.]|nr:GMP synthase subunit A [Methanothrix sp.]MDD3709080.1 GMP synthase subunit A [Methanothrix sp.]
MLVLVVNNYGQFNHLIHRSVRDLIPARMISNKTSSEEIEADGLILGGGPTLERAGNCSEYLTKLEMPILGICLGLQVMAETFGGKVEKGAVGGYAEVDVEVLEEDDILKGLPPRIKTWASHADQVVRLPPEFRVLARSEVCEIEAMRHETRPLYGVQWHPEVVHTEGGIQLLENFLEVCRERS